MKKPLKNCYSLYLAMTVMLNTFISCQNTQSAAVDSSPMPPASTNASQSDPSQPTPSSSNVAVQPFDIFNNFISSGWMGDGEDPSGRYLSLNLSSTTEPHSGPSCVQISYKPGGPNHWAGVVWQNVDKNWCLSPGRNLSGKGFTQVKFWARGEKGGEVVRFKAGGRPCRNGGEYNDSFETEETAYALEKEWKEYTIDLNGKDLSSVISGFCWSAAAAPARLIFYLDDVTYQ